MPLIALISLFIWLSRLDISTTLWNLSAIPWYCDQQCYSMINETQISSAGCLERNVTTEHIFKMFNIDITKPICFKRPKFRQNVCLKLVKGKYFIGTCDINVIDRRISCRKSNDRMSWYRGMQSVSFSGKSCLRWDEVNSTFQSTDFSSHFGPSIRYTSIELSTGMHSLENYCRNPDDWHMGPWCFVMGESRIRREACFKQCEAYNHPEFCLAKMFFPYMLPSMPLFNGAPIVETNSESIKDLSDIIDVLNVVRINSQIRPMFIPTYFNDYIRNYPGDISTRLRCYQTGVQTRIAGPWTYSDADDPFPEQHYWLSDLFKDVGADQMDRERTFRGDGGPRFTRWRPCFLACEDNNNDTIYLKILRDEVLYDKNKKPRIRNVFAHSNGRLMVSNRCFTLGDFLFDMDKMARVDMAKQYPLYHHVLTIGAGCFNEVEHRKKEDDDYSEQLGVLKNITEIGQVKPSNDVMIASLLLLGVALSSFVTGWLL
uniref:Kringle domain-containing protein n=2 Tax=Loa loa TaxID=7209 RepID=A0A1I7VU60_LOALO